MVSLQENTVLNQRELKRERKGKPCIPVKANTNLSENVKKGKISKSVRARHFSWAECCDVSVRASLQPMLRAVAPTGCAWVTGLAMSPLLPGQQDGKVWQPAVQGWVKINKQLHLNKTQQQNPKNQTNKPETNKQTNHTKKRPKKLHKKPQPSHTKTKPNNNKQQKNPKTPPPKSDTTLPRPSSGDAAPA